MKKGNMWINNVSSFSGPHTSLWSHHQFSYTSIKQTTHVNVTHSTIQSYMTKKLRQLKRGKYMVWIIYQPMNSFPLPFTVILDSWLIVHVTSLLVAEREQHIIRLSYVMMWDRHLSPDSSYVCFAYPVHYMFWFKSKTQNSTTTL